MLHIQRFTWKHKVKNELLKSGTYLPDILYMLMISLSLKIFNIFDFSYIQKVYYNVENNGASIIQEHQMLSTII